MSAAVRSVSTAQVNSGSSTSINLPAGVQDGDFLLLFSNETDTITFNAAAGWTSLLVQATQTSTRVMHIYWRVASSEPASYTVGWSASISGQVGMVCCSGTATSSPVDVSGSNNNVSGTSVQANTITTVTDNDLLLGVFFSVSASTWTPPGGMNEDIDAQNSTRSFEAVDLLLGAHGATGNKTATSSVSAANAAALIAVKPAVGGAALLLDPLIAAL